jgi:hypothetical protein
MDQKHGCLNGCLLATHVYHHLSSRHRDFFGMGDFTFPFTSLEVACQNNIPPQNSSWELDSIVITSFHSMLDSFIKKIGEFFSTSCFLMVYTTY